jgi:shikimate kinase
MIDEQAQDADATVAEARSALGARSLVLVGLMGAGKTSVGKRLAARLGRPFRDADQEIEQAASATIEEIFERHGEAAFRDGERRVIQRLLEEGPAMVLATGGGAFIDQRTRAVVKAGARSVWLRADVEELVRRTSRRTNRPLLKSGDPLAILSRLAAEREPHYAEADHWIASAASADETTERVLAALARS